MIAIFLLIMLFALIIDIFCCLSSAKITREELDKDIIFIKE